MCPEYNLPSKYFQSTRSSYLYSLYSSHSSYFQLLPATYNYLLFVRFCTNSSHFYYVCYHIHQCTELLSLLWCLCSYRSLLSFETCFFQMASTFADETTRSVPLVLPSCVRCRLRMKKLPAIL